MGQVAHQSIAGWIKYQKNTSGPGRFQKHSLTPLVSRYPKNWWDRSLKQRL